MFQARKSQTGEEASPQLEQLPQELLLNIVAFTDIETQKRLALVNKFFKNLTADPSLEKQKFKLTNDQMFIKTIKKELDWYDENKGSFRKKFPKFIGNTAYINGLRLKYHLIKDKQKLTVPDLTWFFGECYNPTGKYYNPTLFGQNPTASGQVYQNLSKRLKELYPAESEVGKIMKKTYKYGLYHGKD